MKAISKTAFYCCGTRMMDAQSNHPICGDTYAHVFMNDEAHAIVRKFSHLKKPNTSTVCRHRIIDDYLRVALFHHPDTAVVLIGAGFDSRAFRLTGGNWIEVDDSALISYKNQCLPVETCPNPLVRVPCDILTGDLDTSLSDRLPSNAPVIFVVEGVTVYISDDEMRRLAAVLHRISSHHTLICDLQNQTFYRWFSRPLETVLKTMGISFSPPLKEPESVFINQGYALKQRISVAESCVGFGGFWIPSLLLKTVLNRLKYAYSVFVFHAPDHD